MPSTSVSIAALYQFVQVDDPEVVRQEIFQAADKAALRGTVLLADEGINGTLAGSGAGLEELLAVLDSLGFRQLEVKWSSAEKMPFHRLKVRIKPEIVTLGVSDIDPAQYAGEYVEPADWNALIDDPEVLVIDTRNRYEVALGSFEGAIDPQTEAFRDFPQWAEQHLDPNQHRKVAMFCTGGIRCEKATAWMRRKGFDRVYHLRGGILKYLEETPAQDSRWRGECFVFDDRVSVDQDLNPGDHEICFNCRLPVSESDKRDSRYEKHVSCPACFDRVTPRRRSGLLERARQVKLARQRGEQHVGQKMPGPKERQR